MFILCTVLNVINSSEIFLGCVPTEAEIQEVIVSVEDQENAGTVQLHKFLPHLAGIISEYK